MIYDIIMLQNYTHKLWEEFADEVIRKNDFPVESELLVKIKEISEYAECEKISEQQAPFLGFDGIKFKSAVSAHGYNILFFDTDEETQMYDITQSKVYMVNSLDIHISQVLPVEE